MKLPFITGTKIIELEGHIDMELGAPCPIIIANDYKTIALFIARDHRDYNNLQLSDAFTDSSYAVTFDVVFIIGLARPTTKLYLDILIAN